MDAAEALAELKELSPQLRAIVVVRRDGTVEASTEDAARAAVVGAAAGRLVERAETLGRDLGRDDVAQLQAATPEGSVFAVLDDRRVAVALTDSDPTVGLVFYDLKTLLRRLGTSDVGA